MYLSAGVYIVEDNSERINISAMVDRAIIAQETIKNLSGTRYSVYNEKMREQIHYEKELEQDMVTALGTGEFEIYLQPKCDIQKGDAIVGAETLVRWNSSKKGLLNPSAFIPLLEKNGFIVEVDNYVFELVCSYLRERLDHGMAVVPISVNVSRIDISQNDFVRRYTAVKQKYSIPNGLLQLEFTETIAYDDHEAFSNIIKELRANGFDCSLTTSARGIRPSMR
jgi:EAL domain-containing protein (putative c-di-GMP-specific phosphodiesterase class I)